jgi:hypothetical protein
MRQWWLNNNFRGTESYQVAAAQLYDESICPTLQTTKKIFKMESWKFGQRGDTQFFLPNIVFRFRVCFAFVFVSNKEKKKTKNSKSMSS